MWVDCETGAGMSTYQISTQYFPSIANGTVIANGSNTAGASAGTQTSTQISPGTPQGQLSWSHDGGHVFGNDYQASLGNVGQYMTRLIWRRLGRTRDQIWKLVISDNCKKVLIGAGIKAKKGTG